MQVNRTEKYQQMHELLNEKQWRQYLALEAKERGNLAQVAHEADVSQNTIRRELREVEAGEGYTPGARQRKTGGGRKKLAQTDATLLADLEAMLEPKGGMTTIADFLGHFYPKYPCTPFMFMAPVICHSQHRTALQDVLPGIRTRYRPWAGALGVVQVG